MSDRGRDMARQDDGRTIADMGDVRRPSLLHALPRERSDELRSQRDFADELQDPEERMMVLLGTLKAALSIGMVYVVGFGIAILLMVIFWN